MTRERPGLSQIRRKWDARAMLLPLSAIAVAHAQLAWISVPKKTGQRRTLIKAWLLRLSRIQTFKSNIREIGVIRGRV
jgi:hypothetical protein